MRKTRGRNRNCHHLATIVEKRDFRKSSKAPSLLVGTTRFELATSRTPSERATRLRYVPKLLIFRLDLEARFVKPESFSHAVFRFSRMNRL